MAKTGALTTQISNGIWWLFIHCSTHQVMRFVWATSRIEIYKVFKGANGL